MVHPNVEELLSQYTCEELASILREELDAVGIPYTCNSEDTFDFVPISARDFGLGVTYEAAESNSITMGEFVLSEKQNERIIYHQSKPAKVMLEVKQDTPYDGRVSSDANFAA